jgi:DNA-binding XRE family transcriptional regulator
MKMIRLTIEEAIMKSGLKKKYIVENMKINKDTLTNWCKNRSIPKLDQAVKLAYLLNCDIKDLYINENE